MSIKRIFIICLLVMMFVTVISVFVVGAFTQKWDPVATIGVLMFFMEMIFFCVGANILEDD